LFFFASLSAVLKLSFVVLGSSITSKPSCLRFVALKTLSKTNWKQAFATSSNHHYYHMQQHHFKHHLNHHNQQLHYQHNPWKEEADDHRTQLLRVRICVEAGSENQNPRLLA